LTVKPLFVDTTIQVDRVLKQHPPGALAAVTKLFSEFDFLCACSYSRLEFKRVVLQDFALILGYLCESQSFFQAMQRVTAVGAYRPRRASTLTNILAWIGFEIDEEVVVGTGEGLDHNLALRAESYIRNAILILWKRFDRSVGSVLDRTKCQRAAEGPERKGNGTVDVSIAQGRCKNQQCENANFFQSHKPELRKLLRILEQLSQAPGGAGPELTDELKTALEGIKAALNNPSRLYDYKACCALGDVWMHLECMAAGIKDFATTNYKESQVLCPAFGLTMRTPDKP
jgi:hypothetical protein